MLPVFGSEMVYLCHQKQLTPIEYGKEQIERQLDGRHD